MIVEYYEGNPDIEGVLFCIDALCKGKAQQHYTQLYVKDGIFYATDAARMHVFKPKKSLRDGGGFYRVLKDDSTHVILHYEGQGKYPNVADLDKGKKVVNKIGYCDFSSGVSSLIAAIIRALPSNQIVNVDYLRDIPLELFRCDILENDVIRLSNYNTTAFIMPIRDDP